MTRHRWSAYDANVCSICCAVCGVCCNGGTYSSPCPGEGLLVGCDESLRLACTLADDPCPVETHESVREK